MSRRGGFFVAQRQGLGLQFSVSTSLLGTLGVIVVWGTRSGYKHQHGVFKRRVAGVEKTFASTGEGVPVERVAQRRQTRAGALDWALRRARSYLCRSLLSVC